MLESTGELLPPLKVFLSFFADQLFGDPHFSLHPVRLIGALAEKFRKIFYPWGYVGGFLTLSLTAAVSLFLVGLLTFPFPWLEVLLLYFFIAEKALRKEVEKVAEALEGGDLTLARERLSFLVGRDTSSLSVSECVRAAVETVAENFTDALVGPLFWYAFGGILGATFYKVVETLDSMYGYKTPVWKKFGFFPAKLDDIMNFLPARVAGSLLTLASFSLGPAAFLRALKTMFSDAKKHDSPNSGFTEAAMAGALGIELGGEVIYQGRRFEKGHLGRPLREREVEDILRATKLLRRAAFLWLILILSGEAFLWKSGYPHLIGLITNALRGA